MRTRYLEQVKNELDLRIERFQRPLAVPLDKRPVMASHHLDVLLRHRLLPHPGGFEGLRRVAVVLPADEQSLAGRRGSSDRGIGLDTAPWESGDPRGVGVSFVSVRNGDSGAPGKGSRVPVLTVVR